MATTYIVGPHMSEIVQMTSADTLKLRLLLTDAASPLQGLTGVTFDAVGMTVSVAKPGADFATFPTFGTENWHELGVGWYELVIWGSDATELALLDTVGSIQFYVVCTASNQAHLARKVVPADTARDDQWTDARAAFLTGDVRDLQKVLGTQLPAEAVAGRDAAALGKLLDVATPLLTAAEAMRGTDSAALASVATELRLAELDAANLPSDIDDIHLDYARRLGDYSTYAGGAVASVAGDVGGKVIGGGAGTITGTGARVVDGSGNAVATSANQTTILNRIGAWTGTARNTILGAIQALFRSDADATVPSDVNTDLGSGAGTAVNTTDAVQAIRDRGDSAWVTATGFSTPTNVSDAQVAITDVLTSIKGTGWAELTDSLKAISDAIDAGATPQEVWEYAVRTLTSYITGDYTITATVLNTSSVAISGAYLTLKDAAGSVLSPPQQTNASGQVIWNVPAGVYVVTIATTTGYTWNVASRTVTITTSNGTASFTGTAFVAPVATSSERCAVYGYLKNAAGTALASSSVIFKLETDYHNVNTAIVVADITATTDANGYFSQELVKSKYLQQGTEAAGAGTGTYRIELPDINMVSTRRTIPDAASADLFTTIIFS